MQRCPECQFIYEDNERRCDMDGSELVRVAGSFELSSLSTLPPARSRWRGLLLLAVNLVLAAVLCADYYSFSHRSGLWGDAQQSAKAIVESRPLTPVVRKDATAPASAFPNPAPAQFASPSPSPSPVASPTILEAATDREKAGRKTSDNPSDKPASAHRLTAKEKQSEPKPERINKQKESKIGSMLKKTAHFLKKPFKL